VHIFRFFHNIHQILHFISFILFSDKRMCYIYTYTHTHIKSTIRVTILRFTILWARLVTIHP